MSPEQVRRETLDNRADLFNFGVILYEMLSGQRAFKGKSDVETMHAIVKEEPSDLSGVNPPIPSVLQRIIRHCLEKTSQKRYQSASDIAFDLELLTDPASMPSGQQAATAQKRDRLGWIATAVLSLIVLALAVAYFRRGPTDGQAMYFSVPPPETTTFTGGTRPAISLTAVPSPSWPTILRESLGCTYDRSIARLRKCWMELRAPGRLFGLRTVASSDILARVNSKRFQSVEGRQSRCVMWQEVGKAVLGAGTE